MIGTCLDAALAAAGRAEPLRPRVVAAAMPLVAALSTPRRSAANNDHCETCKVGLCSCCILPLPLYPCSMLHHVTLHCSKLHYITGAVRALDETPEKCSGACAISSYFCHSSDVCCHFCHVTPQVVVNEMHQLVANPELQVQATDYAKQACGLVPSLADSCRADVDQYAPMLFGMVLAYLQPQQVRGCPSSLFTPVLPLCCCVGRAPAPAHIDDERVRTTPNHSRCDHDACVAPFCLHTCRYACS